MTLKQLRDLAIFPLMTHLPNGLGGIDNRGTDKDANLYCGIDVQTDGLLFWAHLPSAAHRTAFTSQAELDKDHLSAIRRCIGEVLP